MNCADNLLFVVAVDEHIDQCISEVVQSDRIRLACSVWRVHCAMGDGVCNANSLSTKDV